MGFPVHHILALAVGPAPRCVGVQELRSRDQATNLVNVYLYVLKTGRVIHHLPTLGALARQCVLVRYRYRDRDRDRDRVGGWPFLGRFSADSRRL
jgi:hypothetical protein